MSAADVRFWVVHPCWPVPVKEECKFLVGEDLRLAYHIVHNFGDAPANVYIEFDELNADGTVKEGGVHCIQGPIYLEPSVPGGYPYAGLLFIEEEYPPATTCETRVNSSGAAYLLPRAAGKYYFGIRTWAEGEEKPEYPPPKPPETVTDARVASWLVEVAPPPKAVIDFLEACPDSCEFSADEAIVIARNRIKSNTDAPIYVCVEELNADGTVKEGGMSCRPEPAAGGYVALNFDEAAGRCDVVSVTSDGWGQVTLKPRRAAGKHYFGIKTWSEDDAEPEYLKPRSEPGAVCDTNRCTITIVVKAPPEEEPPEEEPPPEEEKPSLLECLLIRVYEGVLLPRIRLGVLLPRISCLLRGKHG